MGKNVSNINSWNWSNQNSIKHVLSILKHPIYSNHAQIQNAQILSPKLSCLNLGSWCHCWFYSRSQDHQTSMKMCEIHIKEVAEYLHWSVETKQRTKLQVLVLQSGAQTVQSTAQKFQFWVFKNPRFELRTFVKRFPARGWVSLTPSYNSRCASTWLFFHNTCPKGITIHAQSSAVHCLGRELWERREMRILAFGWGKMCPTQSLYIFQNILNHLPIVFAF